MKNKKQPRLYSYPLALREPPPPRKIVPYNGLGKPLPQTPNDPEEIKKWLHSPWDDAIDLLEGTPYADNKQTGDS